MGLCMCVSTCRLFVNTFAPREGCPLVCVFTGKLNVLVHAHITQQRTFVLLCSLSLQQREAEGWGARAGQHRSSLCREKLGMKLKLPSKARAGTVTWSSTIYTPRRWWWCLHHTDDNRTERRERDGGGERESLPSIHGATDLPSFILPGTKCKVSASLSPHKSLLCWTERGRGRRLSQPSSVDERVFIDQQGEREGGRRGRKRQDVCLSGLWRSVRTEIQIWQRKCI